MKTAILFVTHKYNSHIEHEIIKLHNETYNYAILYVLFQTEYIDLKLTDSIRSFAYSLNDLNNYNYNTWGHSIMNGNFHFVLLNFYRKNPNYDYYWIIEYDVRYCGNWKSFFSFFDEKEDDFISSHIEFYTDNPDWPSWDSIELFKLKISMFDYLRSFNPICRFSNRACSLLDERCRIGDRGHNEVLLPTLFYYYGLKIADFGGSGKFIYKNNYIPFYTDDPTIIDADPCTHRFRPLYKEEDCIIPNMIYHPVK